MSATLPKRANNLTGKTPKAYAQELRLSNRSKLESGSVGAEEDF
jgi:hypothetical protein